MKVLIVPALLLLISSLAVAQEHNLAEAEELVNNQVTCSELRDDQLEMIGEYLMEQMHPGEQHDAMDGLMGGEGSKSLRETHISIAKRMYCGEGISGMMMGSGMMGGMMGGGMSPGYGYGIGGTQILVWIGLIAAIAVVVYYLARDRRVQGAGKGGALRVLRERYARGDIQREEYLEIKKDLER